MTARAVRSELALVRLVLAMAGMAVGWGLAPFLALHMTTVAAHGRVRALEPEVGEVVIELPAAQLHDVRVAAAMLDMAGAALRLRHARRAAVKAPLGLDVRRYFLVAREAEAGLAAAVGTVVAVGTAFLVLGMRIRELARHEQGLRIDRADLRRWQREHHNCDSQSDTPETPLHAVANVRSIDVHSNHVNYRRNDQDKKERHVQQMPYGKEAFVPFELRNLPGSDEPPIDVSRGGAMQARALSGDRRRTARGRFQRPPHVHAQSPTRAQSIDGDAHGLQEPEHGEARPACEQALLLPLEAANELRQECHGRFERAQPVRA